MLVSAFNTLDLQLRLGSFRKLGGSALPDGVDVRETPGFGCWSISNKRICRESLRSMLDAKELGQPSTERGFSLLGHGALKFNDDRRRFALGARTIFAVAQSPCGVHHTDVSVFGAALFTLHFLA